MRVRDQQSRVHSQAIGAHRSVPADPSHFLQIEEKGALEEVLKPRGVMLTSHLTQLLSVKVMRDPAVVLDAAHRLGVIRVDPESLVVRWTA